VPGSARRSDGRQRLMRTVWPDTFVGDDVLTRAISELRRVFGNDVKEPRFIETIPKGGYRLIAPVSSTDPNDTYGARAAGAPIGTLVSRHVA
jgi:DNA-binding winged helix-turn-helix (wHTH) protein